MRPDKYQSDRQLQLPIIEAENTQNAVDYSSCIYNRQNFESNSSEFDSER